jgi:hypothetical protein
LVDFHAVFHVFCKDHFPDDILYPECCHEFHLLTKDSDVHEEYAAIENTLHYREIADSHYDNHCYAFNIVLNAYFKDGCDEDPIIPFEILKNDEYIDISAGDNFKSIANIKGSFEFQDLQTKAVCNRHEEEDDKQKGPDQHSILYVSPTRVEQPTFNNEISKGSLKQLCIFQLDQQQGEVFHCEFDDPIADYLDFIININVQILLSVESRLCHLLKLHCHKLWYFLSFDSRSSMILASQLIS